jgi:peptidyl-prolyl cis-trans isomerase D
MIMKLMRQKFHLWVFWILTVVLAVGLVLPGIQMASNRDAVAVVDGEPIKLDRYEKAVSQALEEERNRSGGELSEDDSTRVRKETLDQLINESLALQGLKKLGIGMSDEELRQTLMNDPTFRDEKGNYSQDRYFRFLNAQAQRGLSPDETEALIYRSLRLSKARTLWASSARVSPAELEQGLKAMHRKVKARALVWSFKALESGLKPSDDDLHTYYAKNRGQWAKPEQTKARHILIKVDSLTGTTMAKAKADELYAKAKAGEDFSKLASAHSQDEGSAKRGGDLGFFSKGDMVPEFEIAAAKIKVGEISQPVLTHFGWHIIKVEGRKKGFDPTFDNSRAKALSGYLEEQARKLASKNALIALRVLEKGGSLDAAAKPSRAELRDTNWVALGDKAIFGDLSDTARLADALLFLDKGQVMPSAVSLGKGVVLAQLTQEQPGALSKDPKKLEERREEVLQRLREQKAASLYQGWLEGLKAQLKIDNRFDKLYGKK